MKVLMLGWELPPHNSGGLGVACYQLCKALAKKGADIDFILPYSADHDVDFMRITSTEPEDVVSVTKAGAYDSYKYTYSDGSEEWFDIFGQQTAYEVAVANIASRSEFDVIHAHDWLTFRAALSAKHTSRKPLVLHIHSIERDRAGGNYGNPLVREIEELALLLADHVISVSQHTKNMIVEDYGIPASKIQVVHNSIDINAIEPLDTSNAYKYLDAMKQQGYKVVVNVGRLTIQKGLANLLQAAQKVIQKNSKTLFLVVGSGEQEYELIELSARLGISQNVIFAGFQRGKKWRDAFAIGDLFVMPSVSEPFGLTPLEAIGYGTPSLISKQSGVSEVISNCLKVDFWDIDEMANKIAAVVNSEGLRRELHKSSLGEYKQLTWSTAADRMLEVYKEHTKALQT